MWTSLRSALRVQAPSPPSGNMSGGLDLSSVYSKREKDGGREGETRALHVVSVPWFFFFLIRRRRCLNRPRFYASADMFDGVLKLFFRSSTTLYLDVWVLAVVT